MFSLCSQSGNDNDDDDKSSETGAMRNINGHLEDSDIFYNNINAMQLDDDEDEDDDEDDEHPSDSFASRAKDDSRHFSLRSVKASSNDDGKTERLTDKCDDIDENDLDYSFSLDQSFSNLDLDDDSDVNSNVAPSQSSAKNTDEDDDENVFREFNSHQYWYISPDIPVDMDILLEPEEKSMIICLIGLIIKRKT